MVKSVQTIAILLQTLVLSGALQAQPEAPEAPPQVPKDIQEVQTELNPDAICLQPPPMVRWEDYKGPFDKVVGSFARKLERKSTHVPRFKPEAVLCSLEIKDKFMLFVQDTVDPISFLSSAYDSGLDQASNRDPTFGQGLKGYGRRFGATVADDTTYRFLGDFLYPTIFGEDPRYYRLGRGTARRRLFHAMEHSVIAHRDSGTRMFNFSEWFTLTTSVAVSNTYHPGNSRGVGAAAQAVLIGVGWDMGFDVLREFWPDIARKLRMPFRDSDPQALLRR